MDNLHLLFESSYEDEVATQGTPGIAPNTQGKDINSLKEKAIVNPIIPVAAPPMPPAPAPRAIVPQRYYAQAFNPLGYPCSAHTHPLSCRYFCWDLNTWPKDKNTHRGLLSANLRMRGCLCDHCRRPGLN